MSSQTTAIERTPMLTTALALVGILLTGDFPGADTVGLEEDHPAVVITLDIHDNIA